MCTLRKELQAFQGEIFVSPWTKLIIAGITIGIYPLVIRHTQSTPLAGAFVVSATTTLIIGLLFFISKESTPAMSEISLGIIAGVLGAIGFGLYMTLSADKTIPASTSLVVINGIALATIIAGGICFFGEVLSFVKIAAIILMTASLSLLLLL